MKKEKYNLTIHLIFDISIIFIVIFPLIIFLLSKNIMLLVLSLIGMISMVILIVILHRTDDKYITEIVNQLAMLIDTLSELDEKTIFPENEDNILSKLQTKIIRLVRIMKNNNEHILQNEENIKSLVSDISHQLKTPISNLKMYSEFLKDDSISETERKEYIDVLCKSVERLNFLSESMIKISRLESGLIHLNMQKQSLNETVLQAVKNIYSKAKCHENEIVYSEDENIVISHDRNWTAEAVFNLLDNAVKYSDKGTKIYLFVKNYGMFSGVEVRDENFPISESERNKIFTRFYRGTNSFAKEGIGIGLHIVREIAVKQGGYIKLNSNKHGNSFTLVLLNN